MQLAPNVVVADRFRLVRQIGQGGMGSVWEAMHLGLDTPCALKFIEGELANTPEAHARFEREAKAAAQLRSPHVVQILDHGVWSGTPYIAMELLDGEDLGKRLARRGRLTPGELLPIVEGVVRALSKAHERHIVHRDLKPDNVFLVRDDDREVVKVLDFGVAKSQAGQLEGSNTKTGAMLGTPYYMSPEQAQGIKAVDHRSDLWSLAVIVYEALTGRRPFESEALGDLLVKIIVSPIPVPSQVAAGLTPTFDAWWQRASSRDPNGRFSSAKELNEALASALGAVRASQPSLVDVGPQGPNLKHTAFLGTPNPGAGTGAHAALGAGASGSHAAYGAASTGPHAAQGTGGYGASTAGPAPQGSVTPFTAASGATFQGATAPVVPTQGGVPPFAIVGAIAAVIVVLGLGGWALLRRGDASTQAGSVDHAGELATATSVTPTATPSDGPKADPQPSAGVAEQPAPSPDPAGDAPAGKATTKPSGGRSSGRSHDPKADSSAKPAASAKPQATATGPINLGF